MWTIRKTFGKNEQFATSAKQFSMKAHLHVNVCGSVHQIFTTGAWQNIIILCVQGCTNYTIEILKNNEGETYKTEYKKQLSIL